MPYAGWGHTAYGSGRFGWTDWGELIAWQALPEIYRRQDASQTHHPLRAIVDAFKVHIEDMRLSISQIPNLKDPYAIPIDLLDYLGYDIDQVTDENKSERLRRSAVGNAPRLYLTKGTDRGYTAIAGMEGYTIEVVPQWQAPCGSNILQDDPPSIWIPRFDTFTPDSTDIFDDFIPSIGSTLLTLRFNASTDVSLVSVTDVSTTNISKEEVLGSVGPTPSTFDLSTSAPISALPVYPGSISISVMIGSITSTITDDGLGNLSGDALSIGTINYATGAMTGVTSELDAGSDIDITYTRSTTLTVGVDYTVSLPTGEVTLTTSSILGDNYRVTYVVNVPLDSQFSDEYALYPVPLYPPRCTICRSHVLVLNVTQEDSTANLEKLIERIIYYKAIHVEIAFRITSSDDLGQIDEQWNDMMGFLELAKPPSESTSSSFIVNPANYWILNDTSDTFNAPNYTVVFA